MSRSEYLVEAQYVGTGAVSAYEFDFLIGQLDDLEVVVNNASGVETQRVRGSDATYLSSVTYDAVSGGGTVNLLLALPSNYTILLLLANDLPTQPYEFRDKSSFTLRRIESAFDWLTGSIQRLTYRANRSIKTNDNTTIAAFNPMWPPFGAESMSKKIPSFSTAGTGWAPVTEWTTLPNVALAVSSAAASAASASASSASQTAAAASAAAAAVSAAAAAVSAAAATISIVGTRAAPQSITAAGGIAFTGSAQRSLWFVKSNSVLVAISANPQIAVGTVTGQELTLIGCNDTDVLTLDDGTGLDQNGFVELNNGASIRYIWDGTSWNEISRSNR